MPERTKSPTTIESVPQDKAGYKRQVDRRFGKEFGEPNRLFDPGLPEDLMMKRSLAPWVPKTALWNLIMRQKGRDRNVTTKPLKNLEEIWLKAVQNNRAAAEKRGSAPKDIPAIRKAIGDRILGKRGVSYREGLADPNRPVRDWDAQKVSPKYYNPKTGNYDLLPGVR